MAARYSILSMLVFISWSLQPFLVLGGGGDPPRGELKIVYAINAGGKTHEDIDGIVYLKDPSDQGVASDFGMRMNIDRVHPNDQTLYQTERYSPSTFGYDIPVKDDGNYVLVLKFSEVYFRRSGAKIFDVILNSKHRVVESLDIFENVGFASAYDVHVPFIVTDHGKKLIVDRASSSPIRGNRIRLDFVKGSADNPKVNAFYVAKGEMQDIPQLPPPHLYDEEEEYDEEEDEREQADDDGVVYGDDEEEIQFSRSDLGAEGKTRLPTFQGGQIGRRRHIRSGPASEDPWELESSIVIYMPLFASIAASGLSFLFLRVVNQKL